LGRPAKRPRSLQDSPVGKYLFQRSDRGFIGLTSPTGSHINHTTLPQQSLASGKGLLQQALVVFSALELATVKLAIATRIWGTAQHPKA